MNKIKPMMMNTLIIACAGLMLLFITPAAHAKSALDWLPYGIVPGKPLPDKAKRNLQQDKHAYILNGKFAVNIKNGVVNSFFIGSEPEENPWHYSVPKKWARLGMNLCTKNKKGASLNAMRAMAKNEGGQYFEIVQKFNGYNEFNALYFEIAGKYKYELVFLRRELVDDSQDWGYCKGGLIDISVSEAVGEDY